MRTALSLLVLALAGCPGGGDPTTPDGPPLAHTATVAIVAAPGDDFRYMGADLVDATAGSDGLTVVYTTTGTAAGSAPADEQQVIFGWASVTGLTIGVWSCGPLTVADHVVQHCRPGNGANLSLVFLDYPAGGLLDLWEGTAVGAPYDQAGLVKTVAAVLDATAPSTIRTLELSATHGTERSDPMFAGALAMLAWAAHPTPALFAYRADSAAAEPANVLAPIAAKPIAALAACGAACALDAPTAADSPTRRYAIGFRHGATGKLRAADPDGQCMSATSGGMVTLAPCAEAPDVTLRGDGQIALALASGDVCLQVLPTGEVVATACGSTSSFDHLALDDDGHLWAGIPPVAMPGKLAYAHLDCVLISGGRPRAGRCGADLAPIWTLAPEPVTTTRAALGLAETGRAVRMGDLTATGANYLCAIHAGRLSCAAERADGTFDAAAPIDQSAQPLDVAPDSLAFGDVDLDGGIDACGRTATGISCAAGSLGFAASPWSPAFARAAGTGGPADATDLSLAVVPGAHPQICALASDGIDCAPHVGPAANLSRAPDPATPAFPAQLDADDAPDWCVGLPEGPACAIGRDVPVTTAGAPWGYSIGGVVEGASLDPAKTALVDIDGDGRADLCTFTGSAIACAPSQGRGFGPRSKRLLLPSELIPTGVWASATKLCAGDAGQVICTP